jgi:hypothetical protein
MLKKERIPERGFSRLIYCLKDSFNDAVDSGAEAVFKLFPNSAEGRILLYISPRKTVLASAFLAASAVAYVYPEQALGLYGFGISYLSTRMKESRNMRSMYAAGCPFFAAQYALDIENGLAGLISATSGAIRGSWLTMIPDGDTKKRKAVSATFAGVSAVSVTALSFYSVNFQNLMILPVFALSAAADYMGDNKSHTARFLKFGAFGTVLAYDATVSGNIGSGLASLLLLQQTYKTAKECKDFDIGLGREASNIQKISGYLASLNVAK